MTNIDETQEIKIDHGWIEAVFSRKFQHLNFLYQEFLAGRLDAYAAIEAAGLLRDLIHTSPLYIRANRSIRLQLQILVPSHPSWDGINNTKIPNEIYYDKCPPFSGWFVEYIWYPYSISEYLNMTILGFVINYNTVTIGEVIRLYANVLGGRHLDGTVKHTDRKSFLMDTSLMANNLPAVAHILMDRIVPEVLRGLSPLNDAIFRRLQSQSLHEV